MNRLSMVEQFHNEMNKPLCDARTESIVAMAFQKGISFEDMRIICDSFFHRPYSKDLFKTILLEDAIKDKIVQLQLSRNGLYDRLPEGAISRAGQPGNHIFDVAEMVTESRINKKRERDSRLFFQLFDEEFFRVKTNIEIEESEIMERLNSGILSDYLRKFWSLPASVPPKFIVPFLLLLPYAGRIAGDLNLTSQCLNLLLGEAVQIKLVASMPIDARPSFNQGLGKQLCGIDMVCGEKFEENYPVLKCIIGPLENSQVPDYLDGGKCFLFLQTFYEFFIPVEADITTEIELSIHKSNMKIEIGDEPILGYSSVLTA